MVGQSDAPFRALCLKYGASCVYTEMLYSEKIVENETYLDSYFPPCDHLLQKLGYSTRPVVVQICGNNPEVLGRAVIAVALTGRADAIDFNLGCPQDRAREGLFGSYLLDKCYWPLVFDSVSAMVKALHPFGLPLFCKIRLLEGADQITLTTEFCWCELSFKSSIIISL